LYGKYTTSVGSNKYGASDEIAVRKFLKGVLSSPPLFNLPTGYFETRAELVSYVKGYNPDLKISLESLSRYKNRSVKLGLVQKSKETRKFVDFVRTTFPNFDENSFYLSK
jgi:hypothetical protein